MSRKKPEIYQTFLASLKGGGVPPVWQKTKLFPVFSCEGIPKADVELNLCKIATVNLWGLGN